MSSSRISDINPLPNTCDKPQAQVKATSKVSKESDDFFFEEVHQRDALQDPEYEYDYDYDYEHVEDAAAEDAAASTKGIHWSLQEGIRWPAWLSSSNRISKHMPASSVIRNPRVPLE